MTDRRFRRVEYSNNSRVQTKVIIIIKKNDFNQSLTEILTCH